MKILALSDEECPALWDHYVHGRLRDYDLIIACGDLKAEYLSFVVTMARCPVVYVHGNHDEGYDKLPPEGCDCIDDAIITVNGLRILGLGGCRWYHDGPYHYTEAQMRWRINRLRFRLWQLGGVDIVVTHAPPWGVGDGDDNAHQGFQAFLELMEQYEPAYLLHGHVHLRGLRQPIRQREYGRTKVVNVCQRHELEIEERPHRPEDHGQVVWRTKAKYAPE